MKRKILIYILLALVVGVSIIAPISCHGQVTELALPYPVKLINPKPIDFYYFNTSGTPYTSTSQVTTQVILAARYQGQTFNVNGVEYWFGAGTADINLVAKSGGGGITNGAINNEIPKSNGTNLISSGLFTSTSGDIDLGSTSISGNRTISAPSSSSNSSIIFKVNASGSLAEILRVRYDGLTGFSALEFPSNQYPEIISNTSITNSVVSSLSIAVTSSGTPANGFGPSVLFEGTNVGSQNSFSGSISAIYTDVTNNSQNADFSFSLPNNSPSALTEQLRITSDGRLYGKSLHNNSGSVTGTANQYIASGTYTPTTLSSINVNSITLNVFNWIRVGNVVTVSGRIDLTPTSSPLAAQLEFSLPISTSLPASYSLSGSAAESSSAKESGAIAGCCPLGNSAVLLFYASAGGPTNFYCTFTYLIN